MAITVGDEGGGGLAPILGTAGSVCAISPSDQVGIIDNLITRIEKLEFALSQVLGANLHADQLSDLSQQVGWVYGVEYMGIPGWIQTEYGTLIPPAGFTMSSSGIQLFNACTGEFEDYQAVVMDENGVLQWGADTNGNLCGEKVQQWDAASGEQDFSLYAFGSALFPNPINDSRGITTLSNTYSSSVAQGTIQWQVSQAGIYIVSASAGWSHGNYTGNIALRPMTRITAGSLLPMTDKCNEKFEDAPEFEPDLFERADTGHSVMVRLAAGDKVNVSMSVTNTSDGTITGIPLAFYHVRAGLVRVSNA